MRNPRKEVNAILERIKYIYLTGKLLPKTGANQKAHDKNRGLNGQGN